MICTEKRMRLCLALLLVNLTFIWGNSLLPGEVSGAFSEWVRQLLAGFFPGAEATREGSGLLRKIAHFSEFATLGMCLCWLISMKGKKPPLAFGAGFLVACADETIQRFVPGRVPALRDVMIDSCGVLVGITLLYFGYALLKRKNNQTILEDK